MKHPNEIQTQVTTPAQLRSLLLDAAVGVLVGKVSVPQANAVVGLSTEVHKSIRQEWDMRNYRDEYLDLKDVKDLLLGEMSNE